MAVNTKVSYQEYLLKLLEELVAAEAAGLINKTRDNLSRYELLIIDEPGYLSSSQEASRIFFRLLSKKYEKTSCIITKNKPFELWGEIFDDEIVAPAILDTDCYIIHTLS